MNQNKKKVIKIVGVIIACFMLFVSVYIVYNKMHVITVSDITTQYLQSYNINEYEIHKFIDYRKKKLSVEECHVTPEEIKDYMDVILESYAYMQPIENRDIVQNGDFIYVSYEVYEKGELIDAVSGDVLKVGSGYYDCKFEELLPGATVGDKFIKIINKKDKENDKELEYHITVDSIQQYVTYTLDEDFVQKKLGYESVENYYKNVEKQLKEGKQKQELEDAKNTLLEDLVTNSDIILDKEEVANYAKVVVEKYSQIAYLSNMELEQYYTDKLNLSETQFYEKCYEEAKMTICKELVVGVIADKEKLSVTQQEISDYRKENNSEDDDIFISQYLLKQKVLNIFR